MDSLQVLTIQFLQQLVACLGAQGGQALVVASRRVEHATHPALATCVRESLRQRIDNRGVAL